MGNNSILLQKSVGTLASASTTLFSRKWGNKRRLKVNAVSVTPTVAVTVSGTMSLAIIPKDQRIIRGTMAPAALNGYKLNIATSTAMGGTFSIVVTFNGFTFSVPAAAATALTTVAVPASATAAAQETARANLQTLLAAALPSQWSVSVAISGTPTTTLVTYLVRVFAPKQVKDTGDTQPNVILTVDYTNVTGTITGTTTIGLPIVLDTWTVTGNSAAATTAANQPGGVGVEQYHRILNAAGSDQATESFLEGDWIVVSTVAATTGGGTANDLYVEGFLDI